MQVKYYNSDTKIGIVRVSRDYLKFLWTSLIFITKFLKDSKELSLKIRILDCKATIKKIETSLKRKSRFWIENLLKNVGFDEALQQKLLENQEKISSEIKALET